MEFLLSLLLWIFGADAAASKPVIQQMNPRSIEVSSINDVRQQELSLKTEGGNLFNDNSRIRHTIIIFEDTHFRQQE